MHCSVCGKNVTHIQRVLTELCCIMLDNVDHSVFWGLFLMGLTTTLCSDQTLQLYFNLCVAFPTLTVTELKDWRSGWQKVSAFSSLGHQSEMLNFHYKKTHCCHPTLAASRVWSEALKKTMTYSGYFSIYTVESVFQILTETDNAWINS